MYQDLSSGLKPETKWSTYAPSLQSEMTMTKLPVWKFPGSTPKQHWATVYCPVKPSQARLRF